MTEKPEPEHDADDPAEKLLGVLERFRGRPEYKKLRGRLRDLGTNAHDEVQQLRQLQKTCRECPEIATALAEAGFGSVAVLDLFRISPETGRIVQAFNHVVERHWEHE